MDLVTDSPSPYAGTTRSASLVGTQGQVTLIEGQTFARSGRSGDMAGDLPQGLFVLDTRVVSRWELRVNGHRLEPLTVDLTEPFAATFVARSAPPEGHADAALVVFRRRHVGGGMRERIEITNHGLEDASVLVELHCGVDFADLFEVKESRVVRRGRYSEEDGPDWLRFGHQRDGVVKDVTIALSRRAGGPLGVATWTATLSPGETWDMSIEVTVAVGGQEIPPRFRGDGDGGATGPTRRLDEWHATLPKVDSDHAGLLQALQRSGRDLGALRIFDPDHPDLPILAAGAPWFMTVFGRDSLLTAWMSLLADSSLAHGVLETLARFQGRDENPRTEEEPGKILHEIRFGGAGGLSLGGGDIYYGTVDATPLFVMLVGELWRWNADDQLVERLLPHVDRALEWIERHGDRDGDGYVEYQRSTDHGLANQGWKDSWDAIRFADGRLAEPPIALCEVQGYVYAAYVARARLARAAGDTATFDRWADKARQLRRRFNEDFWLDDQGTVALALDRDKRPVDAVASNAGHCLWTGILEPERARRVADRLLADDMFSGFGIRTLASTMAAYNPVSYHNGSVWPHDNAICAAGLARYDFPAHAHRVITAQLDVASSAGGTLPELFAGFDRTHLGAPAAYPTSCSPQAWAAAAPLLWLRTLLRLDPWAPHGQVWLAPSLPEGIRRLDVAGLRVDDRSLSVRVASGQVTVEGAADLRVVRALRPPLDPDLQPTGIAPGGSAGGLVEGGPGNVAP